MPRRNPKANDAPVSARAVRVLITRPQPGADETAAALAAAGAEPVVRPVLVTEAAAETPAVRKQVQDLDQFDIAIVVSPAAARVVVAWLDRFWPQYPLTPRWFAVGERTRIELAAGGLQATTPDDPRSEGLLALPALAEDAVAGRRVLLVRGDGGRRALASELACRGAGVASLVTHRRVRCDPGLAPELDVDAVAVTSVDVFEAFAASARPPRAWRHRPVVTPSQRVADTARARGFEQVDVAVGASAPALLGCLRERFGAPLAIPLQLP